jgi:3-hydroxyisobutyrate dehydrogenase-like beta-hydroxyacid dehydrogenase
MSIASIETRSIGIIGAGKMGAPIAHRLSESGFDVTICDRDTRAMEIFRQAGFSTAAGPDELACRCEIILGCVSGPSSFWSVTTGPTGILHGNRVKVYVNIGTTGPALATEIAEALASRGIQTLDAPMTGGPRRALRGDLAVMMSGSGELADSLSPVLSAYASKIVYVGTDVGQAQHLKVANNLITAGNLAIALEALTLARAVGISPQKFLDVINAGSAASDVTMVKLPNHVLTETYDFGATLALVDHDVSACLAAAERAGLDMAIGRSIQTLYREAIAFGDPTDDLTTVATFLQRRGRELEKQKDAMRSGWDVVV